MYDYLNPSFAEDRHETLDSHDEFERLPYAYYGNEPSGNKDGTIGSEAYNGPWRDIFDNLPRSSFVDFTDKKGRKLYILVERDKNGHILEVHDCSWLRPDDFERNRLDTCRLEKTTIEDYVHHTKTTQIVCKNNAGTVFWSSTVTFFPDGHISRKINNSIKYHR